MEIQNYKSNTVFGLRNINIDSSVETKLGKDVKTRINKYLSELENLPNSENMDAFFTASDSNKLGVTVIPGFEEMQKSGAHSGWATENLNEQANWIIELTKKAINACFTKK